MTWFDSDYGYKKKITIDHTKVDGDETDFPVLISVTDNDLRDEANSGHVKSASGYDIIFTNSAEDTQLKHEIEKYTNTSGLLVYWVKVASLSSTADTDIYIYYGKTGVVVDPSTTDTWDSDYTAVWHMSNLLDSTSNNNDLTNDGCTSGQTGKNGDCYSWDGTNKMYHPTLFDSFPGALTIETWHNRVDGNIHSAIIGKRGQAANPWNIMQMETGTDIAKANTKFDNAGGLSVQSDFANIDGQWYNQTLTYGDAIAFTSWLDGVKYTATGSKTIGDGNAFNFRIGRRSSAGSECPITGRIDEVRISYVIRSDNWIKTTRNTQNAPGTFMSWGAENTPAYTETPSDSFSISDVVTFKRKVALSDTITISDIPLFKRLLNLSDSINVSDTPVFKHFISLIDNISIKDNLTPYYNSTTTKNVFHPGATTTFSHTVSNEKNRLLIVGITVEDTSNPDYTTGVTYNGISMTNISQGKVDDRNTCELYYLLNPAVGINDVVVTWGTNRDYIVAIASDYYNIKQQAPTDSGTGSDSNGKSLGVTVTPASNSNLGVGFIGYSGTNELAVSGDSIIAGQAASGSNRGALSYKINGSTSGFQIAWHTPVAGKLIAAAATFEGEGKYSPIFKRLLSLSDSINISDTPLYKHELSLSDSINMDDVVTFKRLLSLSDSINMDDVVTFKRLLSLSDSINISDTPLYKHSLNLSDSINISDLIVFKHFISLIDDINISDTPLYKHFIYVADNIDIEDNFLFQFLLYIPPFTLTQSSKQDLYIYPDGDLSSCTEHSSSTDGDNYLSVDGEITDEDAAYVYWDNVPIGKDLYTLPSQVTLGDINYVQIYARAKSYPVAQHQNGIYKILISPNSLCATTYKSVDKDLTDTYSTFNSVWTENPATSTTWTWNDISNLAIGMECSSPSLTYTTESLTIRPDENGYDHSFERTLYAFNYQCAEDINAGFLYTTVQGAKENWGFDNHTTQTTAIVNVTLYMTIRASSISNDADVKFSWYDTNIGNSPVYGNVFKIPKGGGGMVLYSETRTTNISGGAWTWTNIDNLRAGLVYISSPESNEIKIGYSYIVVTYLGQEQSPEIRTTQVHAKINYDSTTECNLNRPQTISTNHSRNIKMLNFWDGTREVYDVNRSGKSMVLTGMEFQTDAEGGYAPCERVQCVRAMAKVGNTITVSNLEGLTSFNGNYKIRSFGWRHISETPEVYEWILELENDE
jgi:hypothetical protein